MKERKKERKTILFVLILVLFLFAFFGFLRNEQRQNDKIDELQNDISFLRSQITVKSVNWNDKDYNYLAIGNSITVHPINTYWWNECGMAATSLENDYVHRLSKLLNINQTRVFEYAFNFSVWEMQSHDRGETLSLLDGILCSKLDLITIQLGENVLDSTTFESDLEELICHLQNSSPNAKIAVIGDFWDEKEHDIIKQKVCKKFGISFVDLNEIKSQEKYKCVIGTTVYDKIGNMHIVEHDGVAKHPNDEAMMWIAQKVYETVKE